jgi:hypothetical protein
MEPLSDDTRDNSVDLTAERITPGTIANGPTVTVVVSVTLPAALEAVSVYVVVALGLTSTVPDECNSEPVLVPPAKVRVVAFDTL